MNDSIATPGFIGSFADAVFRSLKDHEFLIQAADKRHISLQMDTAVWTVQVDDRGTRIIRFVSCRR